MGYKRLFAPLLAAVVFFSFSMNAFANEGAKDSAAAVLRMEAVQQPVSLQDEVKIDLIAENAADLYGVQFQVQYDSARLEFKELKIAAGYQDFGGVKHDSGQGTLLIPLLRENVKPSAESAAIKLAELSFTAKEAGKARVRLGEAKAVTSESYVNEKGKTDLKELKLKLGEAADIQINPPVSPPYPGPGQGGLTPGSGTRLAALEQAIAAGDAEGALRQLELLGSGTGKLTDAELSKAAELAASLTKLIQRQITTAETASTGGIKTAVIETASLEKAIEGMHRLQKAAAAIKLSVADAASSIAVQLPDADQRAVQLTAEQARLLQQNKMAFVLRVDDGQAADHKLGVYMWNEKTASWDYVRKVKRNEGTFELAAAMPGIYTVRQFDAGYTDIAGVYPEARHAIEAVSAMHLMQGTGGSRFSPQKALTRAEFAALLARLLDLQPAEAAGAAFEDIDPQAWYAPEIAAAKAAGIVKGSGTKFDPNGILTREAMAVMMVNAGLLQQESGKAEPFADDAAISVWAKTAVYEAKAAGMLKGAGGNKLLPQAGASRADAAVILLRLAESQ